MEGAAPARGERRNLTILFADLVSSTALSQQLDPEDFHAVVSAHLAKCSEVVRAFGGCVAQKLGDGLMVYFGYPRAHERSAQSALSAALEVLRVMQEPSGLTPLQVRIGVHTGPVVFGDMSHEKNSIPIAYGITPNLASRVQAIAAPGSVAISDVTQKLIEADFECEKLGDFDIKGLAERMPIYRVLRERKETRSMAPLVGREAVSSQLGTLWKETVAGRGHAVLVTGEPGIGKSRQLQMLVDTIKSEPHMLVDLRCSPLRETSALHPLADFVERRLGFGRDTTADERASVVAREWSRNGTADALPSVAPFLLPGSGTVPGSSPLPPQRLRQIAFQALLGWLSASAARRPVLLVVEDLHWADPSTIELLGMLLGSDLGRVLCLLTARPEFHAPWDKTALAGKLTELSLARLTRAEARELALWTSRHQPVEDSLIDDLLNRAEGVPMFIEEITKALMEANAQPLAQGSGPVQPAGEIPTTLHDSLMARLDRLGSSKRLAQVASAMGRDVPFVQLAAVSGLSENQLLEDLTRLIEAEILVPRSGTQDTYSFRHALIQEAAYASLLRSDRRDHHERIARTIVERFQSTADEQPEIVAHHYTQAGNVPASIAYLSMAGMRALARPALVEAIGAFTRALDALATLPASAERDRQEIELRSALGLTLIASKGYSAKEVEECYARARQLCDASGGDVPVRVLFGIWGVQFVRGDEEGTGSLVPLLARLLTPGVDPGIAMIVNATLGARAFHVGDLAAARGYLIEATACIDLDDPRGQDQVLRARYGYDGLLYGPLYLAWCHALEGNVDKARQTMDSALALADRTGNPYLIAMALAFVAPLTRELGDVEQTRQLSDRGLALSAENGFLFWQAIMLCTSGWVDAKLGMFDSGLPKIQGGLGLLGAIGSLVNRDHYLAYLVEASLLAGRVEEGLAAADEGLALVRTTFTRVYGGELERLRGELLLARGDKDAARACFQSAVAIARAHGAHLHEARATASLESLQGRAAGTAPRAPNPTAPRI